ncbi:MAG: glycosyltransferase family 2 protein [Armatimonadota bacterium]
MAVCIVNWNTRECLARCLECVVREGAEEVVVVDNASDDGSADMVAERFPDVRLIRNEENMGYAAGNNQAIGASSGEYVLLLNPDVELHEGALGTMLDFMGENERAGALGCKLILPDGSVQQSCRTFPTPRVLLWEATGLSRLLPRSRVFGRYRMGQWDYGDVREVDQPMASCLMLRRAAIEEVGEFDERFPIYFNDVDLCLRLKQAGWRVFYTPAATALHHHGQATRQAGRRMITESHRSLAAFYRKHYRGKIGAPAYWMSMALIGAGRLWRVLVASRRRA